MLAIDNHDTFLLHASQPNMLGISIYSQSRKSSRAAALNVVFLLLPYSCPFLLLFASMFLLPLHAL
jgi:hypothetical protein